jgi:hypothetical protein
VYYYGQNSGALSMIDPVYPIKSYLIERFGDDDGWQPLINTAAQNFRYVFLARHAEEIQEGWALVECSLETITAIRALPGYIANEAYPAIYFSKNGKRYVVKQEGGPIVEAEELPPEDLEGLDEL